MTPSDIYYWLLQTVGWGMVSPKSLDDSRATERTPLLSPTVERPPRRSEDEFSSFPELGKRPSYPHSHWLAPDEDGSGRPEPQTLTQFQENGLLSGISKTRFRLVYGGILLGYFVSEVLQSIQSTLVQKK